MKLLREALGPVEQLYSVVTVFGSRYQNFTIPIYVFGADLPYNHVWNIGLGSTKFL